jgi:hypothetical protein
LKACFLLDRQFSHGGRNKAASFNLFYEGTNATHEAGVIIA